jgi:hypothetical protein
MRWLEMKNGLRDLKLEDDRRNRSNTEDVVPPNRGNFDSAFDMLLTFDLAEIKILFCGSPGLVCALIELI